MSLQDLKEQLLQTLKTQSSSVSSLPNLITTALKTAGTGTPPLVIANLLRDIVAGPDGKLLTDDDLLPIKTLISLKASIGDGTLEDLVAAVASSKWWKRFLCCC
jgi:hypothetical protein